MIVSSGGEELSTKLMCQRLAKNRGLCRDLRVQPPPLTARKLSLPAFDPGCRHMRVRHTEKEVLVRLPQYRLQRRALRNSQLVPQTRPHWRHISFSSRAWYGHLRCPHRQPVPVCAPVVTLFMRPITSDCLRCWCEHDDVIMFVPAVLRATAPLQLRRELLLLPRVRALVRYPSLQQSVLFGLNSTLLCLFGVHAALAASTLAKPTTNGAVYPQ